MSTELVVMLVASRQTAGGFDAVSQNAQGLRGVVTFRVPSLRQLSLSVGMNVSIWRPHKVNAYLAGGEFAAPGWE